MQLSAAIRQTNLTSSNKVALVSAGVSSAGISVCKAFQAQAKVMPTKRIASLVNTNKSDVMVVPAWLLMPGLLLFRS